MTDVPPPRPPGGANLNPRYTGDNALIGALYSAHPGAENLKTPPSTPIPPADTPAVRTSAQSLPLAPGQTLVVSVTPLSGGGFVLTAAQGTFVIAPEIALPKLLTVPGATARLVVDHDGPVVSAQIVQTGNLALKPPQSIDLTRLQPGAQFQGQRQGTDGFDRVIYTTPVGSFALTRQDLRSLQGQASDLPGRVTVALTQVGSDIRGNLLGADGKIFSTPLAVSIARTPVQVPVDAQNAGIDKSGRTILATPLGVFLVAGAAPSAEAGSGPARSLGQLINPDAGQNSTPHEPDHITLILRTIGPQISADVVSRDGKLLNPPIGIQLALAEGEAPIDMPSARPRLGVGLAPEIARRTVELLGVAWPALTQSLETLKQISPEILRQVIDRMPKPGAKLPTQLLSALAAIQSGDARQLVGTAALEALRQAGHGTLVDQLEDDLRHLRSLAQQSSHEWRPVLLPFFDGQQLHQLPLMIGRPPEHDGDKTDPVTRFLVGVEFSHLGGVQLDGFVSPADRRFDLTVRSNLPLDDEIRTGARARFSAAMEAGGFKGKLVFQIANPFPIANPDGLAKVPNMGLTDWLGQAGPAKLPKT